MSDHENAEKTKSVEGPAGYNGGNGPGGALKLPIKHYPQTQKGIPSKGDKSTIEGPCTGKEGY